MDKIKESIFERPPVELHASPHEHEELVNSPAWGDLRRQIEGWLFDVRDSLEDPDNILIDKTLHRLGGNAEALRRVLNLPEQTVLNIKEGIKEV